MKLLAIARAIQLGFPKELRPVSFEGEDPPKIPKELEAVVQGLIDAAVQGLKTKNTELLGTQRQLKDQLKAFEGIDPEAVRTLLSKFANDEEAGLIKAGKIEEVLTKRTERLAQDWQKKLDKEIAERDRIKKANDKLAARALAQGIQQAAIKAGALPEAIEDLTLRAKGSGWTVDDDGELVARNGEDIIFGKDGKTPLSPIEWAESLRETAPHLWPKAQGSNAPGTRAGAKGAKDIDPNLPPEERISRARAQATGAPAR